MIEIALCLAIIGFALVAIIGVLPFGLNVQKENREETIIDQDAAVWMSAIRSGARGYDDLTNYVIAITNTVVQYNSQGKRIPGLNVYVFSRTGSTLNNAATTPQLPLTNGFNIIGLLSKPQIEWTSPNIFSSNYLVAVVRAMSGSAVDKFPQNDPAILDSAFSYKMIAEVAPYVPFDPNATNFTQTGLSTQDIITRSNYWRVINTLQADSHSLRLTFRWPLLPNGDVGNGWQTFRTMTGGQLIQTTNSFDGQPLPTPLDFLEPSTYVKTP